MIGRRVRPRLDRYMFRNTAYRTNTLNFRSYNTRGGIRL